MRVKCSDCISPAHTRYEAKAPRTPFRIKIMYNKVRKIFIIISKNIKTSFCLRFQAKRGHFDSNFALDKHFRIVQSSFPAEIKISERIIKHAISVVVAPIMPFKGHASVPNTCSLGSFGARIT